MTLFMVREGGICRQGYVSGSIADRCPKFYNKSDGVPGTLLSKVTHILMCEYKSDSHILPL
jgi:hypothetical protein